MYRVSHQYGNKFKFNYLILYQCYSKSKNSSEKLRFNPSRGQLDFDFFKKFDYFLGSAKNETKRNFFWRHATPFWSKCRKILFSPIHVPGYMEFCFFFKFMYPGTWIWENKIVGHFDKRGWHGAKKNCVLFRFLPTLENNLIFWKKSKSRWPPEDLNLSFSEEVLLLQ